MPKYWDLTSYDDSDILENNIGDMEATLEDGEMLPQDVQFASNGNSNTSVFSMENDLNGLVDTNKREGQKVLPQNMFHLVKIVYDGPEDLASMQRGSKFHEEFEQRFKGRVADVLELLNQGTLGNCPQCRLLADAQKEVSCCSWMYSRYAGSSPPGALLENVNGWGGVPLGGTTSHWSDFGGQDGASLGSIASKFLGKSWGTGETFTMYKDADVVEVCDLLGCGSFGKVYKANVNGVERAVKFLSVEVHDLERVLREAEIGCFLQHPNIVRTFAYRFCDSDHEYFSAMSAGRLSMDPDFSASKRNRHKVGTHYDTPAHTERILQVQIIQEICDVGPLNWHIHSSTFFQDIESKSNGLVSKLECIILIALDIINALIYLGYNGIIHGDLSSDNVLFKQDPTSPIGMRAKIVDFGRSRVEKGRSTRTNSLGTVMYMPPEMLLDGNLNKTSDLYSVGVIIIEMWTNMPAWREKQPVQILFAMSSGKRIEIPPDLPEDLKAFIRTCLCDDPKERPTTEVAFDTLKDMVHPKVLAAHLVGTCVASRLHDIPNPRKG